MSMTTQQMFDRVVNHLRGQGDINSQNIGTGKRRGSGYGYINPNNPCERCAKGILMDCELRYNTSYIYIRKGNSFDTLSWTDSVEAYLQQALTFAQIYMLNELERIYENTAFSTWTAQFVDLALKCNLKMPEYKAIDLKQEMIKKGIILKEVENG